MMSEVIFSCAQTLDIVLTYPLKGHFCGNFQSHIGLKIKYLWLIIHKACWHNLFTTMIFADCGLEWVLTNAELVFKYNPVFTHAWLYASIFIHPKSFNTRKNSYKQVDVKILKFLRIELQMETEWSRSRLTRKFCVGRDIC